MIDTSTVHVHVFRILKNVSFSLSQHNAQVHNHSGNVRHIRLCHFYFEVEEEEEEIN